MALAEIEPNATINCGRKLTFSTTSASLLLILTTLPCICSAEEIYGEVVRVKDGDTIRLVSSDHRQIDIRLMGIDAPEKGQAFGNRAKQSLTELVLHKEVTVQWHKLDRYQRIVGKVLVADRSCQAGCENVVDAGLLQIERGMAWWYSKYKREQSPEDRSLYRVAEETARSVSKGLWQEDNAVAPWIWRKSNKNRVPD